jgi:hypothetical protein
MSASQEPIKLDPRLETLVRAMTKGDEQRVQQYIECLNRLDLVQLNHVTSLVFDKIANGKDVLAYSQLPSEDSEERPFFIYEKVMNRYDMVTGNAKAVDYFAIWTSDDMSVAKTVCQNRFGDVFSNEDLLRAYHDHTTAHAKSKSTFADWHASYVLTYFCQWSRMRLVNGICYNTFANFVGVD